MKVRRDWLNRSHGLNQLTRFNKVIEERTSAAPSGHRDLSRRRIPRLKYWAFAKSPFGGKAKGFCIALIAEDSAAKVRSRLGLGRIVLVLAALVAVSGRAATNDLIATLQQGLFEEEANHNYQAAIKAYESVIANFDSNRNYAATAIFRLGEIYNKQGKTNEATAQYERVLREFSDQGAVANLSREHIPGPGGAQQAAAQKLSYLSSLSQEQLRAEILQSDPGPELTKLQAELGDKYRNLNDLRTRYTESHPSVVAVNAEIKKINDQINAQVASVMKRLRSEAGANRVGTIGGSESAKPKEADEIARIRELIRNSPDLINAPTRSAANIEGRTLLQNAAADGDLPVVKLLLDNGAAVDGIKRGDLTPLHYAAGNGHKAVVDYLLAHGAKVDAQTDAGVTPLTAAVGKGYDAVVRRLLEAGAPVNQATDRDQVDTAHAGFQFGKGQTPLQVAVLSGYPSSVPLLIQKGADVNIPDIRGRTALSFAAEKQNADAVKALLAAHADPNLGVSPPLHISARISGSTEIPEQLLKAGADPNTNALVLAHPYVGGNPDPERVSPLYLAIINSHPAVVRLLLEAKANPNARHQANPLLYYALRQPEIMQALLDAGADPKAQVSNGRDLLQEAVAQNNLDATKILLAHGADLKARGRPGETALHLAAQRSSKEILDSLLEHKPNPNPQDNEGRTPLFYAVSASREDAVAALLDAGADPNVRTTREQSPLDVAQNMAGQRRGDANRSEVASRMVTLLKQHGARDDLPRMDRISVQRPSASITAEVFTRETNDWNRFTLLELVATYYGLLAPQSQTRGVWQSENRFLAGVWASDLPFPDLTNLTIHRPSSDGKSWSNIAVNAMEILGSGDCSKDVRLQWGDVVEVPETDHPIADEWQGLSDESVSNLVKCVSREITVKVKGTTSVVRLAPQYKPADFLRIPVGAGPTRIYVVKPSFMVRSVLDQERLIRFSSDLTRVKVTRPEANQVILDCSSDHPPAFWLRDGDIVEVPDK